ncbi:AAA family ATPase [Williamsia maris]|uniref:AAA family ATPase n=1 Tax=Williamsia maris TaxID=72806 RepID=UPI0020A52F77|nr:AAA family ATPase [Williamsia maris]
MKAPPTLMFLGSKAVEAGATDAQLAQLAKLTNNEIAEVKLREAAELTDTRRLIDTLARSMATQRDTAVVAPEPFDLTDLLTQPDEDAAYRIGELWPIGGRVLLAAPYKAGKSHMVGNVIRTLVDGGKFLDRFDVTPVRKVVLIDTELDTRLLRRWFRDQRIDNTDAVSVVPLRGAVSTFDITDPATRSQWARKLEGADVVILDCLRPVLDALGLSEDKDSGRVLVAFDALLAEIGATEGMVVTHMGHQNERARGDSRLLDWNDAMWKIVRSGDDSDDDATRKRFFSALGRDVSLPEGQLTFDTATRHLAYEDGSRKDSTARVAMPKLLALISMEPGKLSKNDAERRLKDDHGIPQQAARAALKKALAEGSLVFEIGDRGKHLLSPGGDPFTVATG